MAGWFSRPTKKKRKATGKGRKGSMPPTADGSEHDIQSRFIAIIRQVPHPAGQLTFAIPNGFLRTQSMRIRAWREGVKSGVCDLFNPVPVGSYAGQWLEVKTPTGTISPEQKAFIKDMERLGYRVDVCRSVEELLDSWCDYLQIRVEVEV
jgi:hypothetical protein